MSVCGKNLNLVIFLHTINMISVKFCVMIMLIELYLFIPFQRPWLYFKVTAVSNSFNWKFYVLIQLSWNLAWLLITTSILWIYYFWFSHMFKGENWHISSFEKNSNVGFFSDTIEARSFKLCMIITLHCHSRFMTLTLLQGHGFVRCVDCKLLVLDSCPL